MNEKMIKINKEEFEKVFKKFKYVYSESAFPWQKELQAIENLNSVWNFFREIQNQLKK